MKDDNITLLDRPNYYFIGVGGIGMSALARFFCAKGKRVSGYDRTSSPLTVQLEKEGINIHYEDDPAQIPETHLDPQTTVVVYTPAIPTEHRELSYFTENDFNVLKRSVVLGLISRNYKTIAIAGTHGKTTTSSILAHILLHSDQPFIAFVGGISQNTNSNLALSEDAGLMITEADEYDRSFLTLHPDIALITSVDADHLDIYENENSIRSAYQEFTNQLKPGGLLILKKEIYSLFSDKPAVTYGLSEGNFHTSDLQLQKGVYQFTLNTPKETAKGYSFAYPGKHNLENAVGAVAIATQLSIPQETIQRALATYKGVRRRFDVHIETGNLVFIDDYAHHPKEISACIQSIRERYPDKRITGIFQPHLYSRTRDFADSFARSLSELDELILLDIYPAREKPIAGITSEVIFKKVVQAQKTLIHKKDLLKLLESKQPEVLVTMGAGDIDQFIGPIQSLYQTSYET